MTESKPKKLLDQVRDVLRTKHYSYRTEEAYTNWIKRFIPVVQKVTELARPCLYGL